MSAAPLSLLEAFHQPPGTPTFECNQIPQRRCFRSPSVRSGGSPKGFLPHGFAGTGRKGYLRFPYVHGAGCGRRPILVCHISYSTKPSKQAKQLCTMQAAVRRVGDMAAEGRGVVGDYGKIGVREPPNSYFPAIFLVANRAGPRVIL